jgi:cell division protein FtsW
MAIAINRGSDMERRRREAVAATREARRQPGRGARRRHTQSARISIADALRRQDLGVAPIEYYGLTVLIATFVTLGLAMLLSASGPLRAAGDGSPYSMVMWQSLWAVVGLAGMMIVLRVRYQIWQRFLGVITIVGFSLMLLPFVPGLTRQVNDARSWIRIGPLSLQPSELLKLVLVLRLADMLVRRRAVLNDWRRTMMPIMIVTGLAGGLSLAQGDFGSAAVLVAIALAMSFLAGVPWVHLVATTIGAGGFGIIVMMASPRRLGRWMAFLDIEGNKEDAAYQAWQGLLSIANGGLTGSGIGGSRSKLGYLPLAHSDFIFAIIADELGFIGAMTVLGGFAVLALLGMRVALRTTDSFGMLLAAGITAWLTIQAIINVGGVTGVMPVTGLTLPFFSHGGTSLFMSMVGVGLLMNVARRSGTGAERR